MGNLNPECALHDPLHDNKFITYYVPQMQEEQLHS